MGPASAAKLSAERPFPGLRPYGFADHEFFFGRTGQIYALYRLLDQSRFVSVVGSSGSGKSSLVRAGLLPLLDEENADPGGRSWRWVEMQPGDAPLARLGDALAETAKAAGGAGDATERLARHERIALALRQSSFGVAEAVDEIGDMEGKSVVIVVDQFEELFRFAASREAGAAGSKGREGAAQFVQLLLEASRSPRHDVHVVITMRSDFIGDCAQFYGLPEIVSANQFLVPGLTRDQREEVIREPLKKAGATIEPALVERLLNDVGDELDQLPVLQHCLLRLWERAAPSAAAIPPGSRRLTLDHYEQIGGMAGALSNHADEIMKGLALDSTVELVFRALSEVDKEGRATRRPLLFRQLVAETGMPETEIRRVVDRFRADDCSFLVTSPPAVAELGQETRIDVGHEALLRRWEKISAKPVAELGEGTQLPGWLATEERDGSDYETLLSLLHRSGSSGRTTIPPGQLDKWLEWWKSRSRTEAWAERYGGELARVEQLFRDSEEEKRGADERTAREERLRLAAEQHERERELAAAVMEAEKRELSERAEMARRHARRMRWALTATIIFGAIAIAAGGVALYQSDRATQASRAAERESDKRRGIAETIELGWAAHAVEARLLLGKPEQARLIALEQAQTNNRSVSDRELKRLLLAIAKIEGTGPLLIGTSELASAGSLAQIMLGARVASVPMVIDPMGHFVAGGGAKLVPPALSSSTIQIWDENSGASLGTLHGGMGGISALGVSSDGTLLGAGSELGEFFVWDMSREHFGELRSRLPTDQESGLGPLTAIAFLPDNKRAIIGTRTGKIYVDELAAAGGAGADAGAKDHSTLSSPISDCQAGFNSGFRGAVTALAINEDGTRLIAGFSGRQGAGYAIAMWVIAADSAKPPNLSCSYVGTVDTAPTAIVFGRGEAANTMAVIGTRESSYYVLRVPIADLLAAETGQQSNQARGGTGSGGPISDLIPGGRTSPRARDQSAPPSTGTEQAQPPQKNAGRETANPLQKVPLPPWDGQTDNIRMTSVVAFNLESNKFLVLSAMGAANRKLLTVMRAEQEGSAKTIKAPDDVAYWIDAAHPENPTPIPPGELGIGGFGILAADREGNRFLVRTDVEGLEAVQVAARGANISPGFDRLDQDESTLVSVIDANASRAISEAECKEFPITDSADNAAGGPSVRAVCVSAPSAAGDLEYYAKQVAAAPASAAAWYDLAQARKRARSTTTSEELDPAVVIAAARGSGAALARLGEWLALKEPAAADSGRFLYELAMTRPGVDSESYLNWLASAGGPERQIIAKHREALEVLARAGDPAAEFALGVIEDGAGADTAARLRAFRHYALAARWFEEAHREYRPALVRRAALARNLDPAVVSAIWKEIGNAKRVPVAAGAQPENLPWGDWQPVLEGRDVGREPDILTFAQQAFEAIRAKLPDEAAAHVLEAEIAGQKPEALEQFGELLLKAGDVQKAREQFLEAAKLLAAAAPAAPDNSKLRRDNLRRLNEAIGDDLAKAAVGHEEGDGEAILESYGRALALLDEDLSHDFVRYMSRDFQELTEDEANALAALQAKIVKFMAAPISPAAAAAFVGIDYGYVNAGRKLTSLGHPQEARDIYENGIRIRDFIVRTTQTLMSSDASIVQKDLARGRVRSSLRQIVEGYHWWLQAGEVQPRAPAATRTFFAVAGLGVRAASDYVTAASGDDESSRYLFDALSDYWDIAKDLGAADLEPALPALIAAYSEALPKLADAAARGQNPVLSLAAARASSRFLYAAGRLIPPSASAAAGDADEAKCDELAGDPFDPQRQGPGRLESEITSDELDLAIEKCGLAQSRAIPAAEKSRLTYELARAYQLKFRRTKSESLVDMFQRAYRDASIGGHVYALNAMASSADASGRNPDAARLYLEFNRDTLLLDGRTLADVLIRDAAAHSGGEKQQLLRAAVGVLTEAAAWGDADSAARLSELYASADSPLLDQAKALQFALVAARLYRDQKAEDKAQNAERTARELRKLVSAEVATRVEQDVAAWRPRPAPFPKLASLPDFSSVARVGSLRQN